MLRSLRFFSKHKLWSLRSFSPHQLRRFAVATNVLCLKRHRKSVILFVQQSLPVVSFFHCLMPVSSDVRSASCLHDCFVCNLVLVLYQSKGTRSNLWYSQEVASSHWSFKWVQYVEVLHGFSAFKLIVTILNECIPAFSFFGHEKKKCIRNRKIWIAHRVLLLFTKGKCNSSRNFRYSPPEIPFTAKDKSSGSKCVCLDMLGTRKDFEEIGPDHTQVLLVEVASSGTLWLLSCRLVAFTKFPWLFLLIGVLWDPLWYACPSASKISIRQMRV